MAFANADLAARALRTILRALKATFVPQTQTFNATFSPPISGSRTHIFKEAHYDQDDHPHSRRLAEREKLGELEGAL
jgi:hypothetical protein